MDALGLGLPRTTARNLLQDSGRPQAAPPPLPPLPRHTPRQEGLGLEGP